MACKEAMVFEKAEAGAKGTKALVA